MVYHGVDVIDVDVSGVEFVVEFVSVVIPVVVVVLEEPISKSYVTQEGINEEILFRFKTQNCGT